MEMETSFVTTDNESSECVKRRDGFYPKLEKRDSGITADSSYSSTSWRNSYEETPEYENNVFELSIERSSSGSTLDLSQPIDNCQPMKASNKELTVKKWEGRIKMMCLRPLEKTGWPQFDRQQQLQQQQQNQFLAFDSSALLSALSGNLHPSGFVGCYSCTTIPYNIGFKFWYKASNCGGGRRVLKEWRHLNPERKV
uniref:Uncharacterized protein n=1 Tax=Octopus bimaculoides TaxID=37653 RepID=A0A0L8I1S9_OCTBM